MVLASARAMVTGFLVLGVVSIASVGFSGVTWHRQNDMQDEVDAASRSVVHGTTELNISATGGDLQITTAGTRRMHVSASGSVILDEFLANAKDAAATTRHYPLSVDAAGLITTRPTTWNAITNASLIVQHCNNTVPISLGTSTVTALWRYDSADTIDMRVQWDNVGDGAVHSAQDGSTDADYCFVIPNGHSLHAAFPAVAVSRTDMQNLATNYPVGYGFAEGIYGGAVNAQTVMQALVSTQGIKLVSPSDALGSTHVFRNGNETGSFGSQTERWTVSAHLSIPIAA